MSPSNSTGTRDNVSFDNLYPAILQCFVVIASGYIAGRTGHVTVSQGRGIGTFVSTFCLPALLFRSMCSMDFSQVSWMFLLSILIAKATVFFIVALVTLLVTRGSNLGYVGIFAIFCTQSNDFAVGYPILQPLYQETHPDYLNYIYLIAPISLCILNPFGFILMEIHRRKLAHQIDANKQEHGDATNGSAGVDHSPERRCSQVSQRHSSGSEGGKGTWPESDGRGSGNKPQEEPSLVRGVLHVAKGVFLNPIVFMTAIGIVGNFIFKQKVPSILDDILVVLGNAFSACALFYLGLCMVGKVRNQMGLPLLVPLMLIFAKNLLLPLVTWEVIGWIGVDTNASQSLSMYGFLYGTFPTAPSVFLFASQYGVAQDIVATGMVAGTFLSAPLMFVSAKMMTVVVNSDMDFHSLLLNTSFDTSIVGIICCVWVMGILVMNGRWRQVPHRFTVCLLIAQLLGCIGMVCFRQVAVKWHHYVQFILLLVGVFSSRCWTAALALALCLLHVRSLCFVLRIQVWLFFLGFGLPIVLTGLMFLLGAHNIVDKIDPSFHYGFLQLIFSTLVLLLSLIVTVVSVVVWQRKARHTSHARYASLASNASSQSSERGVSINSAEAKPSDSSPSTEQKNYQSCGTALNCASISIEDLVPFPTVEETKSVSSDGCCTEDHGMIDAGTAPIDERMCLLGSRCDTQERIACRKRLRRYAAMMQSLAESPQDVETRTSTEAIQEEYQSTHHLLLLLLLTLSMFIGLFLCTWKIFNQRAFSGIYVELEFLDSVFNYGQSFLVFTVFGFDTRLIFSSLVGRIRRWLYGAELVHLPKPWELDHETRTTCHQFLTFHIQTCRQQLCKDHRFRLQKFQKVFTGCELCDWLQKAGLAADRSEALAYGKRLLLGRVITHVTGEYHFHDSPYFYRFLDDSDDNNC